ncbi:MAG TPA: sulfatase-like hydrolase/transferase [Polyangia bacterium]
MFSRWFHVPVGTSVFAGVFGAGVLDYFLVMSHGGETRFSDALGIVLGLYGAVALVLAVVAAWAAAVVAGKIPGGPGAIATNVVVDQRIATGIGVGALGALVLGIGVSLAHALFISKMHSRVLGSLAALGCAALMVPVAAVFALAFWRPVSWAIERLPRPGRASRTLVLVTLLGLGGLAAVVLALSRADWRVLDLGPLKAIALAVVLGVGHWWFWHRRDRGADRIPGKIWGGVKAGLALLILVLVVLGARTPEGAGVYEAIEEKAWGMRHVLAIGRAAADRDGDGFAAAFGGGDCNDRNPGAFPGAEEVAGDGVDQNCEGGDLVAQAAAPEPAAGAAPEAAPVVEVKKRAGTAFEGNILVLSIDSLRADRLGLAGYRRRKNQSLTPNLDALGKSGAYFRRVWSHAPNTPRSFPSFLTSRYPSEIAWTQRSLNYSPILPQNETFFEQLGRAGLKPLGIFSHFYFSAERALNQGFAEWSNDGAKSIADSNKDIASPRVVPKVIARLEKAAASKERFVLWTHLFEPHSSYMEHPEFPSDLRGVEGLEERYDFEIAFVDKWVGKILAALDANGLRDNTAIVVLADHGEAWGEHKHYFHGQDLTEEQLRVPLIVAVPGAKPVVVDDEVSLVDVGPTLLDLIGLQAPPVFRGRSLMPAVRGEAPAANPTKPVFAELLPASAWPKHEVMMVLGGKKIVHKITERRWELFDLAKDPKQQRDLAKDPAHKALFQELRARLVAFEEGKR